jgi:outer membrane protein OmpA-like peptidoglycan-associated protein
MKFLFIFGVGASALIATACASTQNGMPHLNQAQQAYLQARSDPAIASYAPVPLHEAAQALNKAQEADSGEERRHYAYIAERKVELARTLAIKEAAENQVALLEAQQTEFLLQRRAREADLARREAEEARAQLRGYRSEQQQQELIQARTEIDRLKQEIASLEARQTEQGLLLTFGNVFFETDRADLKAGSELSMNKLADFLKSHPERKIVIEGHTDNTGPEAYNLELSQKRAQSVASALQSAGVDRGRVTIRGMGESYPIAPNTTAAGRQQNRRVEVLIKNEGA